MSTRVGNVKVPILLYHYVGECPPEDLKDTYRAGLWVPEQNFEEQLRQLRAGGYISVSLREVADSFEGCAHLPPKPVVLTFDDGQEDNYTRAFPALRRSGIQATFFIVSDLVDSPGYMTWQQLREMAAAGMQIEAHTASHLDLTRISRPELMDQLSRCRAVMEERLGQDVRALAYPGGHYNSAVVDATRAAGYRVAVTTLGGVTIRRNAQFEMPRMRVETDDSIAAVEACMRESDMWQYTAKRALRRWGLWRPWKKVRKRARRTLGLRHRLVDASSKRIR